MVKIVVITIDLTNYNHIFKARSEETLSNYILNLSRKISKFDEVFSGLSLNPIFSATQFLCSDSPTELLRGRIIFFAADVVNVSALPEIPSRRILSN